MFRQRVQLWYISLVVIVVEAVYRQRVVLWCISLVVIVVELLLKLCLDKECGCGVLV